MAQDVIYLNKMGRPQDTSYWKYYRVTSRGRDGDPIEACLVEWPSFKDIDVPGEIDKAPVMNPGDTGMAVAHSKLQRLLKNKWNINHTDSDDDVIGFIFRQD